MSFNRNTSKITAFAFVLVVLTAGIALVTIGGVAQTETTELVNNSVVSDSDTGSVYVDVIGVADMNGSGPVNATVTLTGVNESQDVANGTELTNQTLTVSENTTESFDYSLTDSDRDTFDEVHILVETSGDETLIESVDWGSFVKSGGGAGLGLGGSIGGIPIVLVVVVIGGYVLMGRD